MNRTIRSCALRPVTILGYVRTAIVYSPLAFEEAENKLYSNSHYLLNNTEKIRTPTLPHQSHEFYQQPLDRLC